MCFMSDRWISADCVEDRKKQREENIIWTISESYDFTPPLNLMMRSEIEELDFIRTVFLGTLYKEEIGEELEEYLILKKNQVEAYEIVWEIFCLTMELRQFPKWEKKRAVCLHYYREAMQKTIDYYKRRSAKEITAELRNTVYVLRNGMIPKTTKQVRILAADILKMPFLEVQDWIVYMEELLKNHFHFHSEFLYRVEEKKKVWHEKRTAKRVNIFQHSREETFQDIVRIASAEFNPGDFSEKETSPYEKDMKQGLGESFSSNVNRMKREIVKYYGESFLREGEQERMEEKLCIGLHSRCKIHMTKNFVEVSDSYRSKKIFEQRRENIEHYERNHRVYRRNILKLYELIERAILPDMNESERRTDQGRLLSSEVWRASYLNENKVFVKQSRDIKGDFQVDLILDASGSQMERQSQVAAQGYVIAEALSMCRIPVRISSFQTLFDYTVIKRYRDYNDERSKNRNLFYYMSEGSNRDGLALRTLHHTMRYEEGKRKIVIILSDGKPNDVRAGKMSSLFVSDVKDYTGREALYDTALEIRKIRRKEIAVLGVFTGKREELEAEKMMFGKDFAYIHKIDRFSDVVGTYLKLQIREYFD